MAVTLEWGLLRLAPIIFEVARALANYVLNLRAYGGGGWASRLGLGKSIVFYMETCLVL